MKKFSFLFLLVGWLCNPALSQTAPVTTLPNLTPTPSTVFSIPVTVTNFSGIAGITLNFYYDSLALSINPASLVWNAGGAPQKNVFADPIHPGKKVFAISWFAFSPATLADNSVLFTVNATFLGGSTSLKWFDDIPGFCEYSNSNGDVMQATPFSSFFVNGSVGCQVPGNPGSISGSNVVCQGQTSVVYSVPELAGATGYNWTVPAGASITSGANTNSITVSFGSSSGSVKVKGTNTCGPGIETSLSVTVNQYPGNPGTIVGLAEVCPAQAGVSYSVSPVANASGYLWTVPNGATIATGNNTNLITVNFPGELMAGQVSVAGLGQCGQSPTPSFLAVAAGSAPGQPAGISGESSFCIGDVDKVFTISPLAGATSYSWSIPPEATVVSGLNTPNLTLSFPQGLSGELSVAAVNLCGTGVASPGLSLTVAGDPANPSVPNGQTLVLPNSTIVYTVPEVPGALIYQWMVIPAEAGSASGFGNVMPIAWSNWSGYAEISVRAISACGQSEYSPNLMVEVSNLVGIDPGSQTALQIYPNPASENLQILSVSVSTQWRILNASGVEVAKGHRIHSNGLDVSSLSAGLYFLEVLSEKGWKAAKFQVQR